ncbi:signal transduction histidine kinase [Arcticibacter tournemirensis]|uniref:histidine kinase n=1 Tax=Arcticibacter tournemirensis TaxID=699437 RepID=A0A5M9HG19_9SPHI|nr:ATP-binding protein [Arcticibacter tournemirensis]KAA8484354.1 PAS domain-containing protein [Arcticibacter tournemirensis]TQM49791.1 signal transduction histidine kinase [Arcticibacter tournemirensis]
MGEEYSFLRGGGSMGGLIRNKDWSETSLGDISIWPQSLRSAVSICLGASFPVCIYWGEELSLIYNDAWSVIPAQKHPWALGRTAKEVWPELWPRIGAMFQSVLRDGVSTHSKSELLFMERADYVEETYYDYDFSPIRGEDGNVAGVFNAGLETTAHILSERRTALLHNLFNSVYIENSEESVFSKAGNEIKKLPHDIPCFILFAKQGDMPVPAVWHGVEVAGDNMVLPFEEVVAKGDAPLVDMRQIMSIERSEKVWPLACSKAKLLPLKLSSGEICGFFLAGISPNRPFDNDYQVFLQTIAAHISSAITNVRAQKERAHSVRQLRSLFVHAPVAIALLRGPDFIVEVANERVLEIWGRTADIVGFPLFEVLPEVVGTPIEEILKEVYSTGRRFSAGEYQVDLIRNGHLENLFVNFVYEPLVNSNGLVEGIITVAHEITDLVTARKQAQNNAEYLAELMKQKDEFLSIASHELKTPVTSVKAYIQLCQRVLNSQERALVFVNKASDQVNRLEKLISDLLDVSKINAGKMVYNLEPFDFNLLLKESIESVQHTSPKHHIILESSEDAVVSGDRLRIEQVINNFLTNAVKYSPNSDRVIIRSEVRQNNVIVSVQDFGIGIEREHINKLFDRFYRVENTAMKYQGLGLGLYISSEILKRHNGSFWIESEPGKGSIFYFRIPVNMPGEEVPQVIDNGMYYKDPQLNIRYNREKSRVEVEWTGFQDLESVKHGCMVILRFLKANNCSSVLNDNRLVEGNWSEASDWLAFEWFPTMEAAGLKFLAWILSSSTFSELAARKSIEMVNGNFTTEFFTDISEAEQWLDRLSD